jgi:AraC family transcriptional regulator, alkane utilization regulator
MLKSMDRLDAFLKNFDLNVSLVNEEDQPANLFIGSHIINNGLSDVFFYPKKLSIPNNDYEWSIKAIVQFDWGVNPLFDVLFDCFDLSSYEYPDIKIIVDLIRSANQHPSDGMNYIINKMCEIIVVKLLEKMIDTESIEENLLSGLVHPNLRHSLIAIHNFPEKNWSVDLLAKISGLSTSYFKAQFKKTIGVTPAFYLKSWRLTLGINYLNRGLSIKSIVPLIGFRNVDSLSRAMSKKFGISVRRLKRNYKFK